jgi:hypothetical protein
MDWSRVLASVSLMGTLCLLGACGGHSIELHGFVAAATYGDECIPGNKNEVAGKGLTVTNESGDVIGSTTTADEVDYRDTRYDDVCEIRANYVVEVEPAKFYELRLEDVESSTQPISHGDLEDKDFRYDLVINSAED